MTAMAANIPQVALRYARALYDLAEEAGETEKVDADLAALEKALSESAELARFVASPLHDAATQEAGIEAVLSALDAGDLVRRFVRVLARNRRLSLLPQMIAGWRRILSEARGEVTARVISAARLTAAQQKKIAQALAESLSGKVHIENEVDPSLIGGLVVKVGSRMIDTSIRTRLNTLKTLLKGA